MVNPFQTSDDLTFSSRWFIFSREEKLIFHNLLLQKFISQIFNLSGLVCRDLVSFENIKSDLFCKKKWMPAWRHRCKRDVLSLKNDSSSWVTPWLNLERRRTVRHRATTFTPQSKSCQKNAQNRSLVLFLMIFNDCSSKSWKLIS